MRFQFILARDLGMTVAGLRARMTHAELVQWHALYASEQHRDDADLQTIDAFDKLGHL